MSRADEMTNPQLIEVLQEILKVIHTSEHPAEYSEALRETIMRMREVGMGCVVGH